MPDTTTIPRGDALICEISQPGQGLLAPWELYSQPGCNGRIFLRQGYPSTSRIGSTRYVPQFPNPPIVSPPLQLFDSAGRVFRLDFLVQYRLGESIRYWLDENPKPEPYVDGVDYIGEILRSSPSDNLAVVESEPRTMPVDCMAVGYMVPAQNPYSGFQEDSFTPNEREVDYRNNGKRRQTYSDTGLIVRVPPAYVLKTAHVVSGRGNSGKLSLRSHSTHSNGTSAADHSQVLRSSNPSDSNQKFSTTLQPNHPNRLRQDSTQQMRTYGAPARMMASSGSDNPNWPTQNTYSQEGEYLTIARTLASSGPDQSNRPTQNTNYQVRKYLPTARMTASSSPINLRTSNNPAISNLVSAFSTGISGQSTVARNAGSFLLSAATTSLGGNSTLPPTILAQSNKFSNLRIRPLPSQTLTQLNDIPDPLSKITTGNVPSNNMIPRLSTEIQGSADFAPVAEPNAQTQTYSSQAFPTFAINSGQSGYRSWTPIGSSLVADYQPTLPSLEQSECEAAQARARSAFLWASINAMKPPEVGVHTTSGSAAPVDTPATSNIMREQKGPRGVRDGSARRARGTAARRGRGGVAQRGHLHYAKLELSEESKPKRRKYDGDEKSDA